MELYQLNAEPRTDVGKGASRRLRQSGRLPGIVYGTKTDATAISLNHNDVLQQLQHEAFFSRILTMSLNGKDERVVLKDLQRHPTKPLLLHIDLQRIDEREKLTMRVPIHFINEDKCVGVKTGGGVISHILSEIEVSCLPKDLPEFITIDLEHVELNQTIHLGEVVLPEGVENYSLMHGGQASQPVVSVYIPRVTEEEEEEAAAAEEAALAAEGEAAPEGEAAAPAAEESREDSD